MISLEKFKIESETLNLSCVSPKLTQMLEFCLEYKLNYPLFEVQRVLAIKFCAFYFCYEGGSKYSRVLVARRDIPKKALFLPVGKVVRTNDLTTSAYYLQVDEDTCIEQVNISILLFFLISAHVYFHSSTITVFFGFLILLLRWTRKIKKQILLLIRTHPFLQREKYIAVNCWYYILL